MFFIAVTKSGLKDKFQNMTVEEIQVNSLAATIVTDHLLSKYITDINSFSIIESPLKASDNFKDVIFTEVSYDKANNTLSIYKAAISGRPIYYHINSMGEFFCSTHISMLRNAGVRIEENTDVLPEFFIYRYVMPPNTMYRNIKQLSFGSRLKVKLEDKSCKIVNIEQYAPPLPDRCITDISDASNHVLDLLTQSIQDLEVCKKQIAVLLSGGIDSSILTSICKRKFSIDESYSTGYPFEKPELNIEKQYALSAAKEFGMNHHYYESNNNDYLLGFLEAISLAEEPLHHLQSVCLHLLFKNGIQNGKTIIIQGLGAGGLFGNFRNFLYQKNKNLYRVSSVRTIKTAFEIVSKLTGRGKKFLNTLNLCTSKADLSDPKNLLWSWHCYGSKEWVCDHFNITLEDVIKEQYRTIQRFEKESIYNIWSMYSLLGDEDVTLSIWNKIGEGNGKIIFSPFYELEILNYVFSMSWKLKLKKPENILRKEIARKSGIPEFIIDRPKAGFGLMRKDWSCRGGIFEPIVPLASKVFEEKQIRLMQSSEPNQAMTFWNILNYAIWKRLCINDEPLINLLDELKEGFCKKSPIKKNSIWTS